MTPAELVTLMNATSKYDAAMDLSRKVDALAETLSPLERHRLVRARNEMILRLDFNR